MENKKAYGYYYRVFWDARKDQFEARALGINLPDVTAPTKLRAMSQMEAQIKRYRAEVDRDILPLLKLSQKPSLAEIGPLARARGITSVSDFWRFVERVQRLWTEARSSEADWDLP